MNLSSFSLFCGQTNLSGYVLMSKSQTHPLTGKQIQMRYTLGTHEVLNLNGSVRGTVFLVTDRALVLVHQSHCAVFQLTLQSLSFHYAF